MARTQPPHIAEADSRHPARALNESDVVFQANPWALRCAVIPGQDRVAPLDPCLRMCWTTRADTGEAVDCDVVPWSHCVPGVNGTHTLEVQLSQPLLFDRAVHCCALTKNAAGLARVSCSDGVVPVDERPVVRLASDGFTEVDIDVTNRLDALYVFLTVAAGVPLYRTDVEVHEQVLLQGDRWWVPGASPVCVGNRAKLMGVRVQGATADV